MFKKGDWVQVHSIVLNPEERAPQVPEDTKKVPLEMWVKGFLLEDANIGDIVEVETVTNRIEKGELVVAFPVFEHSFGKFIPEILEIDKMVRKELFGDVK